MGKPTGFLEYERQTSEETEPKARIKNFKEFHSLCPRKNREFRGPGVWPAECRSASTAK